MLRPWLTIGCCTFVVATAAAILDRTYLIALYLALRPQVGRSGPLCPASRKGEEEAAWALLHDEELALIADEMAKLGRGLFQFISDDQVEQIERDGTVSFRKFD